MVKLAKVFLVAAALQCRFGGSESKEEGEAADCNCGVPLHDSGDLSRIIGGAETVPNEYPWIARLSHARFDQEHLCGGAVVSDRHVLTAAHCTDNIAPSDLLVHLGDHRVGEREGHGDELTLTVESVSTHPDLNWQTLENDLALLLLSSPVDFSAHRRIRPICLPSSSAFPGDVGVIAGWGVHDEADGSMSESLRAAEVEVWADRDCQDVYGDVFTPGTMICAAGQQDNAEEIKDTCRGDSGGPLAVRRGARFEAAAVTSFGVMVCAMPGVPGVYASVYNSLDWIEAETQGGSFCSAP